MDSMKEKMIEIVFYLIRNSTRAQIRVQCYPICRE